MNRKRLQVSEVRQASKSLSVGSTRLERIMSHGSVNKTRI